jgi:hypothetical protein
MNSDFSAISRGFYRNLLAPRTAGGGSVSIRRIATGTWSSEQSRSRRPHGCYGRVAAERAGRFLSRPWPVFDSPVRAGPGGTQHSPGAMAGLTRKGAGAVAGSLRVPLQKKAVTTLARTVVVARSLRVWRRGTRGGSRASCGDRRSAAGDRCRGSHRRRTATIMGGDVSVLPWVPSCGGCLSCAGVAGRRGVRRPARSASPTPWWWFLCRCRG